MSAEPTDDRLYGIPDAEHMHFHLADAYENQIDPYVDEHDRRPQQIEEWTSVSVGASLPSADYLIELAGEMAVDDLTEDGWYDIENAGKHPEVLAAFIAALDLWASKTKYRMADKLIRTWEITWDDNGEPLADGEPIYRKAHQETPT